MDDTPTTPRSRPRRSLTKTQLETPAGVELLSLCEGITSDGKVTEAEVAELRGWLERNRDSGLPSEDFLAATVERILEDGRITPDELGELHKALEAVLPSDLRRGAQEKRREVAAEERRVAKERAAAMKSAALAERLRNEPLDEFDFMVTGVMHEGRADVVRELLDSDDPPLTAFLARDVGNPHSRYAVEVRIHDGRSIGYVPEFHEQIRARDVARHLDAGAKHRAWIKRILTGGRAPIPIVVAEIFARDAIAGGAVTQDEVPGDPVEPHALPSVSTAHQARATARPAASPVTAVPRGTITHRPPIRARPESTGNSKAKGCVIIGLVVLALVVGIALVARSLLN